MRYYIIAGEASGDLHGSNLMKELQAADADAQFRFFGGELMQAVGGELVKHYREMAFMGFLNVLLNIKTIRQNIELCKKDILRYQPDVLILIDYPGFNLRIAEFAQENNCKVFYYISPKLWAWKEYRVKKIRECVDEMFTIFPFETAFYKKHGIEVNYVGNPLMDSIQEFQKSGNGGREFRKLQDIDDRPVIALLSGSRVQEIKKTLPLMKKAVEGLSGYQVIVAGVASVDTKIYEEILAGTDIRLIFNSTYEVLSIAHAAIVASGTAALETALFNVPQTVVYKMEGGLLADVIMRHFVLKTPWVSLPNIILQRPAVAEYIQKDMQVKKVKPELEKLLKDTKYREKMLGDYKKLHELMGEPGCSRRVAEKIHNLLTLNAETKN